MRNIIKYYYDLDITRIRQVKEKFYLNIGNDLYVFCPCEETVKNILNYLYNEQYHQLILTKNKSMVISFNDMFYALFKVNTVDRRINISDILNSRAITNENVKSRWIELWSLCVDEIELQLGEVKNSDIHVYAYYYIGLAENAIQLLKTFDFNSVQVFLAHRRVGYNTRLIDFYNPCDLILDTKVRDIAEYYKDCFFYNDTSFSMQNIYKSIDLMTTDERKLFIARMMYPTYFFDRFEEFKNNGIDLKLVSNVDKYEKILIDIINYIKKTTYIHDIDWLINQ